MEIQHPAVDIQRLLNSQGKWVEPVNRDSIPNREPRLHPEP
jgi:hypothetical protein